jgi:hypothetical protein
MGIPMFSMNVCVPPVLYSVMPSWCICSTIGANPSLSNTEIRAEEILLFTALKIKSRIYNVNQGLSAAFFNKHL